MKISIGKILKNSCLGCLIVVGIVVLILLLLFYIGKNAY